jgi:5-methylcytosine-specific restriction endonuclease McrA
LTLIERGPRVSRAWDGGSTRAWRRIRAQVLIRDGNVCQIRLPGCTETAEHVHHTMGRAATGDDERFLAAACAHCNLQLGAPNTDPEPLPRSRWA